MKPLNKINILIFGLNTILFSIIATNHEDKMRVAFGLVAVLSLIAFLMNFADMKSSKKTHDERS